MSDIMESPIVKLDVTNSSNNYAMEHLIKEGWKEGTVVFANFQTKGKGQMKNSWESEPGKNILMSIVLYPNFIPVKQQFLISKVVALGVSDVVSLWAENVSVKWPNDIYVGDKKIAGILIENALLGNEILHTVAGIGLNVNQQTFVSDAPNPVSLGQLTHMEFDREEILQLLIGSIEKWYDRLKAGGQELIDEAFLSRLYRLEVEANFTDESGAFQGKIVGVNSIGQLLIEKKNGSTAAYHFKEVAFVG
ncbi:MAG TPA: biotin--[acetyl-CoA-carboxylase] ligase [Prolixibacteraceae bacterium]|nr:biotin--[acetyl-CoA-carboxylase] ligase [Prolixibacteraceae bacterium]